MSGFAVIILYVYQCVPVTSIQMTAMKQGNYAKAFAQRSLCTKEFFRKEVFTQGSFYTEKFTNIIQT